MLGLAILVFLHYQAQNSYKVKFTEDKNLGVKVSKVHYSGTKGGRVEWELVADSATRSKGDDVTVFDNVSLTFYTRNGTSYTMFSKEGRLKESTGEMLAAGGVKIESTDEEGYTLETGSLSYSMKTKHLATEDPVQITSGGMDIKGMGLQANIDEGNFTLLKDVKAVFKEAVI